MGLLDALPTFGGARQRRVSEEDRTVLSNLESFFKNDFKTADREQVQGAIADFGVLEGRATSSNDPALTQRLGALRGTTSEASKFLEASQPLADRVKNTQSAIQGAPGLTRYNSLLSGLAGDQ